MISNNYGNIYRVLFRIVIVWCIFREIPFTIIKAECLWSLWHEFSLLGGGGTCKSSNEGGSVGVWEPPPSLRPKKVENVLSHFRLKSEIVYPIDLSSEVKRMVLFLNLLYNTTTSVYFHMPRLSKSFEVGGFIVGVGSWFCNLLLKNQRVSQQSSWPKTWSRWWLLPAASYFWQACMHISKWHFNKQEDTNLT